MIHILFTPGSFGSALEWGIRTYSHQYDPLLNAIINPDGSWHSFKKMFHITHTHQLSKIEKDIGSDTITTIIFPLVDWDTRSLFDYVRKKYANDKIIIITISDMQTAELVLLMKYDKIVVGGGIGMKSFVGEDNTNIKKWNETYTSINDMKPWEYREYVSGVCSALIQEYLKMPLLADPTWLKIPAINILNNFLDTVKQAIDFADLDYRHIETPLLNQWIGMQQKNINLLNLINDIVYNTVNKINFSWQPLHIVAEALVQKKLQEQGYQIRCYGLNEFPTDSITLNSLLEQ